MPDIAMCQSNGCPKKHRCFRNAMSGTKPDTFQTYFMQPPWDDDGCDYFISIHTVETDRITHAKVTR